MVGLKITLDLFSGLLKTGQVKKFFNHNRWQHCQQQGKIVLQSNKTSADFVYPADC